MTHDILFIAKQEAECQENFMSDEVSRDYKLNENCGLWA